MASSIALRRFATAASKGLWPGLTVQLRLAYIAPSITRAFNTSAQMKRYDEDDNNMDDDRRRCERLVPRSSGFFSDVFDPFVPTRSLSQVLNLLGHLTDNPLLATSRGISSSSRRGWDVKEDAVALHLRMDMPGLGKEHVKVSVEENTQSIKAEGEKESEDGDASLGRRYSCRINLPPNLFRLGEIKAEMKNGVLKVVLPKVKENERKDAFQVIIG